MSTLTPARTFCPRVITALATALHTVIATARSAAGGLRGSAALALAGAALALSLATSAQAPGAPAGARAPAIARGHDDAGLFAAASYDLGGVDAGADLVVHSAYAPSPLFARPLAETVAAYEAPVRAATPAGGVAFLAVPVGAQGAGAPAGGYRVFAYAGDAAAGAPACEAAALQLAVAGFNGAHGGAAAAAPAARVFAGGDAVVAAVRGFATDLARARACCGQGGCAAAAALTPARMLGLGFARLADGARVVAGASHARFTFAFAAVKAAETASYQGYAGPYAAGLVERDIIAQVESGLADVAAAGRGVHATSTYIADAASAEAFALGRGSRPLEAHDGVHEELVVVARGDGTCDVYSRHVLHDTQSASPPGGGGHARAGESALIPLAAIAARYLLQKAFEASVGAFVHVLVTVATERYFGPATDWEEAWANADVFNLSLVFAMGESMVDPGSPVVKVALAIVGAAVDELSSPPPGGFSVGGFFRGVAINTVVAIATEKAEWVTRPFKRVLTKYSGPIPATGEVKLLARTWFSNPGTVRAWESLIKFPNLRTNTTWLTRVTRWGDEGLELIDDGARVVIKKNGDEVGEIVGDLLKVKYPHYGGDIVCHRTKTTTVIGKWEDQVTGGGTSVPINSKISTSGPSPGGVNALSEAPNPNWTDQQIWDNLNEPWLRDAASRGDVIRAVSDPTLNQNIFKAGSNTELSFFGREHELLTKPVGQGGLGYTYDASIFSYVR